MDLQLSGKRALVTGASKGIGRAIAEALASEGCDLVLVSRDKAALDIVAGDIAARTGQAARVIAADLSRQAEIERVARDVGELDILVNNAGAIPQGTLDQVDDARWRQAWDLKVFGFIGLSRALYPALKARRGVILNIIGFAGEQPSPGYIVGAAGNASLMAFTRALGKGASADGMRVVAINPGPVATARMEASLRTRAAKELGDPDRWAELQASLPFGRAAKPEEIAASAAFLVSPRSAYTNGAILTIDGGS